MKVKYTGEYSSPLSLITEKISPAWEKNMIDFA